MKFAYRKMSLLLVDPISLSSLEDSLKEFQFFRLWTAKSGEEALEILADKPVNLLITGIKLKPMSGFQLLETIRKKDELRNLPVLLMLDRQERDLEAKATEMGANGFINLPIKTDSVQKTVAQILAPFIDEEEEAFLTHMNQARLAMRKKKWDQAEEAYRAALEVRVSEEAQLGLARILRQKGSLEEAEKVFIACLRSNPKSLKAFLGLASVYKAMGRHQDALKVLAGALNAARQMEQTGEVAASIYFYMGEIELQLKNLNEALGLFQKASEEIPQDAEMNVRAGDALVEEGFLEESESFYNKALQMNPELAHVYNKLGIAYRRQKKFDMALKLYEKALAFHPKDENLHYNIGRCHWDGKCYGEAVGVLEKALELNPEFKEAKQLLGAARSKAGQGK